MCVHIFRGVGWSVFKRLWIPLLFAAVLVATGLWTQAQWLAFDAGGTQWAHDLAFFNQILWSGTHGGPWASPLLLEPQGLLKMVHFSPLLVLIAPIYALFPHPKTLLAVNTLVVASAALPLGVLAQRVSKDARFGLLAGLAFLLYMPTLSAAQADFRPLVLMIPGFATLALGGWTRRWGPTLLGAALICFAREEAAYLLVTSGAVILFRSPKHGAAVLGAGVAWFVGLLLFKENFFFHFDPTTYASSVATQEPTTALLRERGHFALQSWLSGYLLAPLGWLPALMGLPAAAAMWLDHQREWQLMTGPYVHLRSVWLGCMAAAGTLGGALAARRLSQKWAWAPLALGVLMCLGNAGSFLHQRGEHRARMAELQERLESPQHAQERALLARVEGGDRVATDYPRMAALSGRSVLWNVEHLHLAQDRPPHWIHAWPIGLEPIDTVLALDSAPIVQHLGSDWQKQGEAGELGLWRRVQGFPDCPSEMVSIPGGQTPIGATREQVGAADWPETWNLPRPIGFEPTKSFCMDRYEHPNTLGQLPTVWVNWDQANAACQSQGKRLCKEPEWIRACAGELGRDFGYGEVQEPGRCNDAQEVGEHDTLAPIGRNPACQSAWGVHDLQGNVSEWVHQSWSDDPSYKVLRGGTLWTAIYGRGCYSRHAHEGAGPSHGDDGFRCCQ